MTAISAAPGLRGEPDARVSARWLTAFATAWLGIWMAQLTPIQLLLPDQVDSLLNQGDSPDGWISSVVAFGIISGIAGVCALMADPVAGALSDRRYLVMAVALVVLVTPFVVLMPDAVLPRAQRPVLTPRAVLAGLWVSPRWVDQPMVQNGALKAVCEIGVRAPALTPPLNRAATRVLGEKSYTDVSHAVFSSPRHVRFRECEYAVPRDALPDAVRALRALIDRHGWRISFPVELRVAAADDLWLSTAAGRDTGYIAVHHYWREDHRPYFQAVDELMRSFEGRPHWGKIHYQDAASLAAVYPRLGDFRAVRDRLDPDRVFANDYLRRVLGSGWP